MDRKHVEAAVAVTLFVVLVWVVGSPSQAFGQGLGVASTLTGQVTDQSGAVMPGVQLSLLRVGGGEPINTVSNQAGYYEFPFLRPATYLLTAKMKGFGDVTIPNIALIVSQTASINITMKPGAVVQEITVSSSGVALETQTSTVGGAVGQVEEQQMPLLFRDSTTLIDLVPGVSTDNRTNLAYTSNGTGTSFQWRLDFEVNGGYREQAVMMVDGVDVTFTAGSFTSTPVIPSPDLTQEFKVQTNNLGPEYGRGLAVLNVVTKSGTNSLHGTLFEFVQNQDLNAQDLFDNAAHVLKPASRRNQYGGTAGGPVYIPHLYDGRNKTFWFVNIEQLRQRKALPVALQVPDAAELTGDFSGDYALNGTPITLYNPNAPFQDVHGVWMRPAIAGNKIPESTWLDPTFAKNVLGYYPAPNNVGLLGPAGQYTGINNFRLATVAPLDWYRYDIKADQNIGSNMRLMFRFSRSNYYVVPVNIFNNAASSQGYTTRDDHQPGNNGVLSWTWAASPTTVVSASVSMTHFTDNSSQPAFDPTVLGGPFASGVVENYINQYVGGGAFPYFTMGAYGTMGNNFGNNFDEPGSDSGITIGVTHMHGKHSLKAGFQGQILTAAENDEERFGGAFNFGGSWTNGPAVFTPSPNTGNGIADFLLGLDQGATINAGFSNTFSDKYVAFYFADDFRATPKLTLNVGFRYDVTTPSIEKHDAQWRFDPDIFNPIGSYTSPNYPGQTVNAVLASYGNRPLQGAVVFPGSPGMVGRGMVPVDRTNFGPRLGLAWQIKPKLVFRAGVSKIYGLSPDTPGPCAPDNGSFAAATSAIYTVDGIHPYTNIENPWPSGFNVPTGNSQGELSLLGTDMWGGATGQVTPYQWQYNGGFQYELPGNSLLSITYAGGLGHRLTCAFFACGDQIPANLVQQYGSAVNSSVPNPFYGIITNPTVALSTPTVQLGQLLKQWPAYTDWTAILPPWQGPNFNHDTFQSAFNALEVGFNKSFSHGLTLTVAYTYSKLLTNSDSMEGGYLGPLTGYQNNTTYHGEWSLSASDVTHHFVIGHVWDLPFGKGLRYGSNMPSVLDKVIGHWQFTGMSTFSSGFPLGISESGHTTGAFGGGDRPDMVPGQDPCGDMSRSRGEKILGYMNPNAFYMPPNYSFGNASRNLNGCRADGIKNFDWGFFKFIPFKEKYKFEIRSEFFNAFNRPELASPNTSFNSAGFGAITFQNNLPRIIQFGLKLDF